MEREADPRSSRSWAMLSAVQGVSLSTHHRLPSSSHAAGNPSSWICAAGSFLLSARTSSFGVAAGSGHSLMEKRAR